MVQAVRSGAGKNQRRMARNTIMLAICVNRWRGRGASISEFSGSQALTSSYVSASSLLVTVARATVSSALLAPSKVTARLPALGYATHLVTHGSARNVSSSAIASDSGIFP